MNLTQLLLIRICCISAPFVWILCVTSNDEDDYFFKFILPVLFISTFACFFKEKSLIQSACAQIFWFMYNYKSAYFNYGYDRVTIDIFVAGTHWRNIFDCLMHDLISVLKIFQDFSSRFFRRYGQIRVGLYSLASVVQAILYVFLLYHCLEHMKKRSLYDFFMENPRAEISPDKELSNESLPPFLWNERMLISRSTNYTLKYRNDGSLVSRHGKPVFRRDGKEKYGYRFGENIPVKRQCEEEILRYTGEDVFLNCSWYFSKSNLTLPETKPVNISWTYTHDGKKLLLSERHTIENIVLSRDMLENCSSLPSKLYITHLKPSDFGEYQLWAKVKWTTFKTVYYLDECNRWEEKIPIKHISRILIARFLLRKRKQTSYISYVPVGEVVALTNMDIHLLTNESDINILHMVDNGLTDSSEKWDTDRLCNDKLYQGCSSYVYFYFNAFWKKPYVSDDINQIITVVRPDSSDTYKLIIQSVSCLCAQAYGEHSFVIQREFFNKTLRKWTILESELPYKFIILPRKWMFSLTNYSIYEELGDLSGDIYWKKYVRVIQVYEEELWKQRMFIECCVANVLILDIMMLLMIITKLSKKCINIPIRNLILEKYAYSQRLKIQDNTLPEIANKQRSTSLATFEDIGEERKARLYDTMIVNCIDDQEWTLKNILPVIEQAGHKVFFPDRDVLPGHDELLEYNEAISRSFNFVVICSLSFMNDGICNRFVILKMLHRFYEERNPRPKILFIKYGPCKIPDMFLLDENVQMIDWTTHLTHESKCLLLNRWASRHKAIANG